MTTHQNERAAQTTREETDAPEWPPIARARQRQSAVTEPARPEKQRSESAQNQAELKYTRNSTIVTNAERFFMLVMFASITYPGPHFGGQENRSYARAETVPPARPTPPAPQGWILRTRR